MYIVHVTRQFRPAIGGIESVVEELASAQVAAGHKVRVVTLDRIFKKLHGDPLTRRELINGIEVVRIPFFGSTRYPIAPSVLKFIRNADIVHVHAIDFFFDFIAWTKPIHRRRLVVSTHGGFFHTQYAATLKRIYFSTITRLSLTWYDGVAAVSVSDYDLFSRLRQHGMVCIENGVDARKYAGAGPQKPVKAIVWIGRFAENKRLDRVIGFLAALRQHDKDWQLKISGSPFDLDVCDVSRLAQDAGVAQAVEISVSPTDSDIRELFADCSVIISASDFEGFGMVAVEGLSAGLFPVLSNIPAFRKQVERTGIGMLVDFARPDSAARIFLDRWREFTTDYAAFRAAATGAATHFDWQDAARAYITLYYGSLGTYTRRILDVAVSVWTRSEAVEQLDRRFEQQSGTIVAFANANSLNLAHTDARVRGVLREAIVLNDGIGVDLASKLLFGSLFPENLNGTDFTPYYLRASRYQSRIYLLGGRPGVAQRAAKRLKQTCPQHLVVGCRDGYFPRSDDRRVARAVRASRADIILVAMGNPDQELWLHENLSATGCRLGFAVGALFDFMADDAQRAPSWMRSARLEWTYRLLREPRRLWRRYVLGNPVFLLRIFGQWWSGARI
jgi:alpha-1,3-mannosyltransferase